jgi:hypothetical protein
MLVTLGSCNSRAGTAAREYAPRYPGRRHPDTNVFRRSEQCLYETGSVAPTAHVNGGRPRAVRTLSNEDAIPAAAEREPWRRSRDTAPELGLSQPSVLFMTTNYIHTTTCGARIYFQMIVLNGRNFANSYCVNTLRMSSFYVTFCGQTKEALRVRVCLSSTAVTSNRERGYQIRFTFGVWAGIIGGIFVALPDGLTVQRYGNFLETLLPRQLEDLFLAVRQRLWF